MNTNLEFSIILTVPQSLSVIACLWFFFCYILLPKRTLGLKIVLILCVSDIVFHITMLILLWYSTTPLDTWGLAILNFTMRFSIFWAASIAVLAFRSLRGDESTDPEQYTKRSLVLSIIISGVLSVICAILHHSHVSMIFTLIIPLALSVTLNTVYYVKAAKILQNYPPLLQQHMNRTIRNLYIYSFIQLITVGPTICYYLYDVADDELYDPFDGYVTLPLGLSGLINSTVYFFQRRGTKMSNKKESNLVNISSTKTTLITEPTAE